VPHRAAACWDLKPSSVWGFRLDIGEASSLTREHRSWRAACALPARLKLDFVVRPAPNTTATVRGKNNTTGNALAEAHIAPP